MSYNILSQELLQDNLYLYRHCPPGVLPWDYRLPNLLSEIRQHDADVSGDASRVRSRLSRDVLTLWCDCFQVLCLQEVQEDHYEGQIKPALQTLGRWPTDGKPPHQRVAW